MNLNLGLDEEAFAASKSLFALSDLSSSVTRLDTERIASLTAVHISHGSGRPHVDDPSYALSNGTSQL